MNDVKIAPADFAAWSAGNQTFQSMALFQENGASLSGIGETIRIKGATVTHEMAATLGIKPILGRDLLPGEDRPGRTNVMLLGYTLWRSKFGAAGDVVGRVVQIDDEPYTVVGILPPTVIFPASRDYWIPAPLDPNSQRQRGSDGVARLKPGVTLEQARADLMRVHKEHDPDVSHKQSHAACADAVARPLLGRLSIGHAGTHGDGGFCSFDRLRKCDGPRHGAWLRKGT